MLIIALHRLIWFQIVVPGLIKNKVFIPLLVRRTGRAELFTSAATPGEVAILIIDILAGGA